MTVTVANVSNTNTFDYWRNRTNELAAAMSTSVVTVGGNTVGSANVFGTFFANTLSGNNVYLSNTVSNVNIGIPNTVQKSTGSYYLNANGSWTTVISPATSGSLDLTNSSIQTIDSYPFSSYKAVEYLIYMKNAANSDVQVSKLLTFYITGSAYVTEYAMMKSNANLATFSVYTNSTHLILNCTPYQTSTNVAFARINV